MMHGPTNIKNCVHVTITIILGVSNVSFRKFDILSSCGLKL
jgi:hypothetical protein